MDVLRREKHRVLKGCVKDLKQNSHEELNLFKQALLSTGLFEHRNSYEYTCQCPYCHDNRKHCYVKIDTASDSPVVFWCHKCIAHGWVGKDFLSRLNIEDIKIPRFKGNKPLDDGKGVSIKIIGDTVDDKDDIRRVVEYVHGRVGHYPTLEELKMFQYVGNPRKYTSDYLGYNGEGRPFNNRHWFKLTNGNITGRWKDDNTDNRWMNWKSDRIRSSGLYTLKKGFDTYKPITIVIAEGIFDIIGLYYNGRIENGIFVGVAGKGYERGIKHILSKGIFGDSVSVRIYKDPNVDAESIKINPIIAGLFNSVDVYYNSFDKDYGILPSELDIHKVLNWKGCKGNGNF